MKPRTTTSDVTAPPEQSQLEVCNIEDKIGILHRQLDSGMCSTISTLPNGEDATIKNGQCEEKEEEMLEWEFQASSLHAFILVGLRDPDTANQQNFAPAAEQRFPRGLLQPERGTEPQLQLQEGMYLLRGSNLFGKRLLPV